jgi:hypothetical protein
MLRKLSLTNGGTTVAVVAAGLTVSGVPHDSHELLFPVHLFAPNGNLVATGTVTMISDFETVFTCLFP